MTTHRHSRRRLGSLSVAAAMLLAIVVAIPLLAQAKDTIAYTFVFEHTDGTTTTVTGTATDNNTFVADAGGTDKDDPAGMTMHVSCSDPFPDGWGEKEGPDPVLDAEWRVQSYFIQKGDKTCGTPPPPPLPSIDLEKATNGEDADDPTGPEIPAGDPVTWTFVITNDGEADLFDIVLTDREVMPTPGDAVRIDCPRTSLAVGASMTCTATGTAVEGQYGNLARVTGTARLSIGGTQPPPGVTADGKYAIVTFYDPATGDRTTLTIPITKNDVFVPGAGGTSQDDPIGMTMHLSCSDTFPGGWGAKQGPDPTRDSAWQVEDYWIFELKGGELKTKCGSPIPIEQTVTDEDPSHYVGIPADPAIDIEKATNGEDADDPTGPEVPVGSTVTWTYVVTNTGEVDLFDIRVRDNREGLIDIIDYLAPGESATVEETGIAVAGQYANTGCSVGYTEDRVRVTDCDPSHYFGKTPGLTDVDIEKHTNGEDADAAPGPTLNPGDTVVWTYIVTNTGDVDLFDLRVTDDKEGFIGTIAFLAVGETATLEHRGIARPGQYRNEGCVAGEDEAGNRVEDCDPSHYDPPSGTEPAVDIEKATNGHDADDPRGPEIPAGSAVTWTYVVTNTGAEPLWGVFVYDEQEGRVPCPARFLDVGASMTCTLTGTARAGQYANEAWVTGWGRLDMVADTDWSHYYGVEDAYPAGPAVDLEKATNGADADVPPGPRVDEGAGVVWTYVVTNTGAEPLYGLFVYDEQEGRVGCPARFLDVGASMTCTLTGTARAGQYANEAWVTAWGSTTQVADTDWSHYTGYTPYG